MNARQILPAIALPLALWACTSDLYPVAPDVPVRQTTGSPVPGSSPGTSPVVQQGNYGGQLVKSGSHYLEFLGFTPAGGKYTLYLFVWDSALNPIPFAAGSTAKLTLGNGRQMTLNAVSNRDDGSLFFFTYPEASFETLKTTVQAEVSLAGSALSGSFQHPTP